LPAVPEKHQQIKLSDIITSFIFTILFLVLFAVVPQVNLPFSWQNSGLISIFNPEVLIRLRWLFIAASAAAVLNQSIRFLTRRHTLPVFLATLLEVVLQVTLLLTWFGTSNVLNPVFVEVMGDYAPFLFAPAIWAPLQWLPAALSRIPLLLLIIFGGVLLGLLIDLIETSVKTYLAQKA